MTLQGKAMLVYALHFGLSDSPCAAQNVTQHTSYNVQSLAQYIEAD